MCGGRANEAFALKDAGVNDDCGRTSCGRTSCGPPDNFVTTAAQKKEDK